MPEWLPALNAALILGSGVLLIVGRILIWRGRRTAHRNIMLTATLLAILFLVVYVTRAAVYGSHSFGHQGETIRWLYLGLLLLHTVVSVVVIPPICLAIIRARRGDFGAHRQVARIAFPLWLFVAGSGWLVWWMLYHL